MASNYSKTNPGNWTTGDGNSTFRNSGNDTVTVENDFKLNETDYQITAAFISCLIVATVLGNSSVILCFIVEKSIRTFNNIFILSLAMADLLVGLIIMPLTLTYDLTGQWTFGGTVCEVLQYLDSVCCSCSILNLCAISTVRYLSITHPLKYSSHVKTPSRAGYIIGMVWALALALNFPSLAGWNTAAKYEPYQPLKFIIKHDKGYIIYTVLTTYFLPLSLIIFASVSIILALRKSRRKIGVMQPRLSDTIRDGPSVDISSCAGTSSVSAAAGSIGDNCFTIAGNMERPPLRVGCPSVSRSFLSPNNIFTTAKPIQHEIPAAADKAGSNLLSPPVARSNDTTNYPHSPTESTNETFLTPSTHTSASSHQSPVSSSTGNLSPNTQMHSDRLQSDGLRGPGVLTSSDYAQSPPSSSDIELPGEETQPLATSKAEGDIPSVSVEPCREVRPSSSVSNDVPLDGTSSPPCRVIMVGAATLGIGSASQCSSPSSIQLDEMPGIESPVVLDGISFITSDHPGSDGHHKRHVTSPPRTVMSVPIVHPPDSPDSNSTPEQETQSPPPIHEEQTDDVAERNQSPLAPSVVISTEASSSAAKTSDQANASTSDTGHKKPKENPLKSKLSAGLFLSPPSLLSPPDRSPSPSSSTNGNFLSPEAGTSRFLGDACDSVSAVRLSFISKAETIIAGRCEMNGSKNNLTMNAITKKFNQLKVTTDVVIGGNRMTGRAGHRARFRLRDLRERRAVKSLAVIAIFFSVCWTPFYVIYVMTQFCPSCVVPNHLLTFTVWLGYSNSCLNPILYTVFNSAFKDAFVSIWKKVKARCHIG